MTESEYILKVSENIRVKRLEKGIRQVDLAYEIGIEATNLRRIESGKTCPTLKTICRISFALNLDVIELLPNGKPNY